MPEPVEIVRNLEDILENQKALAEQLQSMKTDHLLSWIGLKEACASKGVACSTIQKPEYKHLMLPLSERQRVGKALKWPRDVILKWLLQKDRELEEVKSRLSWAQTILTHRVTYVEQHEALVGVPFKPTINQQFEVVFIRIEW